jgi:hypothetical protein
MRTLLFNLLIICGFTTVAQTKIPLGVYSGNGGLWYIKNDSSFVFIAVENDFIKTAGVGKWSYRKDSIFTFWFDNSINSLLLYNNKVEYHSETKYSFDTMYLSGRAMGTDGKPCSFMSIKFAGTKYVFATNKEGYFNVKNHISHGFKAITFIKRIPPEYYPVTFELSPTNNVHIVNITIPFLDSSALIPKENNEKVEIPYTKRRPRSSWSIGYIPGKEPELRKLLIAAQTKQPLHKRYFAELLRRIKE